MPFNDGRASVQEGELTPLFKSRFKVYRKLSSRKVTSTASSAKNYVVSRYVTDRPSGEIFLSLLVI